MDYRIYKVDLPENTIGQWSIQKFTVTQEQADRFNFMARIKRTGRDIDAGTYTKLIGESAWNVMMSDTPAEINDHLQAIEKAKDNVLITGLGIGVVLNACLMKPEVTHCTVVEIDPDVIALVAPHYQAKWGDRLTIINEDAFKYIPPKGTKYSMIWHDIWPAIYSDNLKDMKILKDKYRKYKKVGGWMGCWVEKEVKELSRRNY